MKWTNIFGLQRWVNLENIFQADFVHNVIPDYFGWTSGVDDGRLKSKVKRKYSCDLLQVVDYLFCHR